MEGGGASRRAAPTAQLELPVVARPLPAPTHATPRVERDMGGEYTLDTSIRCVACNRPTTVRIGVNDGHRTADPRGVCGMRARCTVDPEENGFEAGTEQHACWDCLNEHGQDGYQKVIDRAARVGGWHRSAPREQSAPAAAPPASGPRTRLGDDVLRVLSGCVIDGDRVRLPGEKLDRKLYARVNEALEALGGKWNRKAKAHVFAESPADALDAAISTGTIVRPKDLGWYPTPEPLARDLVARAGVKRGMRVLEPSAGEGAIARALREAGAEVQCIEIDAARVEKLRRDGFHVYHGDFLDYPPTRTFDAAVMNPPFGKRADVAHVTRALEWVRAGGHVVSVMSGGVSFRADAEAFRARVIENGYLEALPEGSFRESGTDVRTVVAMLEVA